MGCAGLSSWKHRPGVVGGSMSPPREGTAAQLSLDDFRAMRQGAPAMWPVVCEQADDYADEDTELGECLWSPSVALDRKHRPQVWDEPSSTVRREWCRYPQEAHLLDEANNQYRKLTVA